MNRDRSGSIIYMDNSSTTKPDARVVEAVVSVLRDDFGNPSSLHRLGAKAESLVEEARESVARMIGARPGEIYFTSGGTEANNWAITESLKEKGKGSRVVSTTVEHPSVIETLDHLHEEGYEAVLAEVDENGAVNVDELMESVGPDTALVSVMLVQNEIGTIQPCREIGRRLAALGPKRPWFHVDAVQGFARLPIDVAEWGVDLLSMSAHKIHGIKGAGALYIRKGRTLGPMVYGGGQESGYRSGTENVPGIRAFGVACDVWAQDREAVMSRLSRLRGQLIEGVRESFPEAVLHGPEEGNVAPYIAHFSFPGFKGESLLHGLEARDVFVSTGSACSAHKARPSRVILSLGRGEEEALSALRFSMSRYTTEQDVAGAIRALKETLRELSAWRTR